MDPSRMHHQTLMPWSLRTALPCFSAEQVLRQVPSRGQSAVIIDAVPTRAVGTRQIPQVGRRDLPPIREQDSPEYFGMLAIRSIIMAPGPIRRRCRLVSADCPSRHSILLLVRVISIGRQEVISRMSWICSQGVFSAAESMIADRVKNSILGLHSDCYCTT